MHKYAPRPPETLLRRNVRMYSNGYIKRIEEKCENSEIKNTFSLNMKDCPNLYEAHSIVSRSDAVRCLEQYKDKIKWKLTGDRSVDLGSADGGVTKILETYLPPNYESLTGYDISERMMKYSNEKHGHNRLAFKLFDIEGRLPKDMYRSADHVFSFYALHLIQNQVKAFQNIYNMIDEDGDCLLTFLAHSPSYDTFRVLANLDKWKAYHKNKDNFLSPYYECQEPDIVVYELMKRTGFKNIDVKCKQLIYDHDNIEDYINLLLTVNPFVPDEIIEDYTEDMKKVIRNLGLVRVNEDNKEFVHYKYNLMVVYAQK